MPRSTTGGIQSARQVVTQFFLTAPVAEAEALLEIAVVILGERAKTGQASGHTGDGASARAIADAILDTPIGPDGRVKRGRRPRTGLPAGGGSLAGAPLAGMVVGALPDQGTPGEE